MQLYKVLIMPFYVAVTDVTASCVTAKVKNGWMAVDKRLATKSNQ